MSTRKTGWLVVFVTLTAIGLFGICVLSAQLLGFSPRGLLDHESSAGALTAPMESVDPLSAWAPVRVLERMKTSDTPLTGGTWLFQAGDATEPTAPDGGLTTWLAGHSNATLHALTFDGADYHWQYVRVVARDRTFVDERGHFEVHGAELTLTPREQTQQRLADGTTSPAPLPTELTPHVFTLNDAVLETTGAQAHTTLTGILLTAPHHPSWVHGDEPFELPLQRR